MTKEVQVCRCGKEIYDDHADTCMRCRRTNMKLPKATRTKSEQLKSRNASRTFTLMKKYDS